MTPRQARAARAMLGFTMKTVCARASVGKRTLTEYEADLRSLSPSTQRKIQAFYIENGISFAPSDAVGIESVSFTKHTEKPLPPDDQPRPKSEHLELIDFTSASLEIGNICNSLSVLKTVFLISKKIMLSALEESQLNQREIAGFLNCTPSFINLIVMGKKPIPPNHWAYLQRILSRSDICVRSAVLHEKTLIRRMKKIQMDVDAMSADLCLLQATLRNSHDNAA